MVTQSLTALAKSSNTTKKTGGRDQSECMSMCHLWGWSVVLCSRIHRLHTNGSTVIVMVHIQLLPTLACQHWSCQHWSCVACRALLKGMWAFMCQLVLHCLFMLPRQCLFRTTHHILHLLWQWKWVSALEPISVLWGDAMQFIHYSRARKILVRLIKEKYANSLCSLHPFFF